MRQRKGGRAEARPPRRAPEMSRSLKRFAKLSANTVLPTVIYSGKSKHDSAGISRMDFRDDDMPVS